jgi:hypothetical protein
MGVVCADFDGDGHADLATTALEGVFLSYGLRDAKFEEPRKLIDGWCSSISVADFDSDGQLDLFVGRYVQWSAEQDIWCTLDGALKSYCTPELYEASSCVLLMGTGDRRFSDRSRAMRVDLPAKTLGSVALDVDADGDVDILVANDTMPDFFLRNEGDHFDEVGIEMGMALSTTGMSRAGMGIDALFLEEFELPAFVVAHFSGEATGLFVQHGESGFFDEASRRGVGAATRPLLSFGLLSVDLDLDGQLDLVSANGHIESEIARWRPGHSFRQPLSVLRNDGGNFVPAELSIALPQLIGRGLASADLDGDGDADLVVCQNGDTPLILRNDSTWQRVLIVEAAAAASVEVVLESGRTLRRARVVGNSYLSSSESALRFGLLATDRPHRVLVNGEQLEPASWAVQEMTQG